ncbi:MAG: DnaD domain protein [Clostridia bacterium]|nr:DnaD domain protein [Clostridia bacterium]
MASFSHIQKSIPIPMEFINKYMINANATYVKVYLYGLLKCYEECEVTNAEIAEALDILETDVNKAWRYWKKVGLVHSEKKGSLVFDIIPAEEVSLSKKEEKQEDLPKEEKTQQVSMKDISQSMAINPSIKETITTAEKLLKKTLTQREITAIYNFMDWYAMTGEMVLVLLEYCINIEKTSFAYIEKVAASWNEQGINTLDAAVKVLNRQIKENKIQNKCKKMFGIDRSLSGTEAKYISSWVFECSMSESMIKAAYERTVNNTGKLSFPYMNTIIKAWFEKGIKTVSQIEQKDVKKIVKKNNADYEADEMAAIERKLRLERHKR